MVEYVDGAAVGTQNYQGRTQIKTCYLKRKKRKEKVMLSLSFLQDTNLIPWVCEVQMILTVICTITTLGTRWHDFFFYYPFKYFINLFYFLHCLSFLFLVPVLCSHSYKKKQKQNKKNMNLELLERGDLPITLFLTLLRVYIINCQLQLN